MVVETNGRAIARQEAPQGGAMVSAAWNAEQTNVIKTLICPGASDAELSLFAQVCKSTGLNPFARQIYGIMRWDGRQQREVLSIQTSIDGFRLAAQRSGEYAGQVGPEWCAADGVWRDVWLSADPPAAARVGVVRKGWAQPTYAVATWAEYCQRGKGDVPSPMWKRMPAVMLAKCAEALALRKCFPAELSGLYSRDEMAQADNPPPSVTETVAAVVETDPPPACDDCGGDITGGRTRNGDRLTPEQCAQRGIESIGRQVCAPCFRAALAVQQQPDDAATSGDSAEQDDEAL